jgi:hypothetical protein
MARIKESHPTSYAELNHVMQEFVGSVQANLGEDFLGAYLQGSFATGDYDLHSDVDFIIVMEGELSDDQVQALQGMHGRIFGLDSHWAQHLDGSYFPQEVISRPPQPGKELWYLDNGHHSLVKSTHCNTLVVRWVVREHGVTLAGPPPETLVEVVPPEMLREEIRDVITDWGGEILEDPERFNNRFYQSFIVLSYCRMLHSLSTGTVGSKQAGAEWAKANLDPAWTGLIDQTWDGRPNPALAVRQPADPEDFEKTLEFVRFAMDESNEESSL